MIAILIGLVAMTACLALQTVFLVYTARHFARSEMRSTGASPIRTAYIQISVLMVTLMIGNVLQILIWALIYRFLGGFDDLESSIYFSGVTFTTLGYGDVLLKGRIRMLAPLQAANGVMMFGLSSAALLAAVQRAVNRWISNRPPPDLVGH